MKKSKMIIISSLLILACTVGYVFASTSSESLTNNSTEIMIMEVPKDQERTNLPIPTEIKPLSKDLRELSDEVLGNNVIISLSQDEKVKLYKKGHTFEEIELAETLANEKNVKDVNKILKENKPEIKELKNRITKEKKVKTKSVAALDQETIDYWVLKGYRPDQVKEAYIIGKKMNLKLEPVFEMIDSGEIVKLHYKLYQESLIKGGNK